MIGIVLTYVIKVDYLYYGVCKVYDDRGLTGLDFTLARDNKEQGRIKIEY